MSYFDYSRIYNERSQNGLIVRWVDKCIESNSKAITITSLQHVNLSNKSDLFLIKTRQSQYTLNVSLCGYTERLLLLA